MSQLRIVIADDNYLVREGTRRLLEDSGEVTVLAAVGSAPSCSHRAEASSRRGADRHQDAAGRRLAAIRRQRWRASTLRMRSRSPRLASAS